MSLEEKIAEMHAVNGWVWKLKKDDQEILHTPDSDDILQALDKAAGMLYAEPVGAQLEVGRLIIKKLPLGFDVYVWAGDYT